MATKPEIERIAVLEEKVDTIGRKLDDHMKAQDAFFEELKKNIGELNLILRVLKWVGWAITIVTAFYLVEGAKAVLNLFKK